MRVYARVRDLLREPEDDLLRDPETAYISLKEEQYKAEQELADRYRSFVAEILRISLAGIAIFGFLYNATFASAQNVSQSFAAAGVLMFASSTVFSLIFLFFYAEGLRFYIIALRYYAKTSPSNNDIASAKLYLDERLKKINVCRWSKAWASITLALGGVFMAVAISILLWCGN